MAKLQKEFVGKKGFVSCFNTSLRCHWEEGVGLGN